MADTARIRKTALEAIELLKLSIEIEATIHAEEALELVEWIAENTKYKRTAKDRARDKRRSAKTKTKSAVKSRVAEMKARMEKLK